MATGEETMPYWKLFYHVIWSTANRLPLIEAAWEAELHGYIWGKAAAHECIPYAVGGMQDHIHLVIAIPPKVCVAALIGQLKGSSSHHINQRCPSAPLLWQVEYGVLSFSESALPALVNYVHLQKLHHAENTLRPEWESVAHPNASAGPDPSLRSGLPGSQAQGP
jgi:putative transposase